MSDNLFQLWAFDPGDTVPTILPMPMRLDAGMALSDISSMSLVYPIGTPSADLLDDYCDVELRYWDGAEWVCPPQGRFLVIDRRTDVVQETVQPTRSYTLVSWSHLLGFVLQTQTGNLDEQGNRKFANISVAEVAETLIAEGQSAGFTLDLSVDNQATPGGWSPAYPPGKSVADILAEGRDQGFLEWLILPDNSGCGRRLTLFDDVGVDRSVGDDPVVLRAGVDFSQTPSQVSARDLASSVLVAGDNQKFLPLPNPGADIPYGILWSYVSASGLDSPAELQVAGQARLDAGTTVLKQHTRTVDLTDAKWLPFRDYSLGDTVLAPNDEAVLEGLRIRQITISFDGQKWGGNLVLGDHLAERNLLMDRRVRQLSSGGSLLGNGSPVAKPAPPAYDNTPVASGSSLSLSSKLTMVEASWDGLDSTGAPMAQNFDFAFLERSSNSQFSSPVNVGRFDSAGNAVDGPLSVGSRYYYRVVTVNEAGGVGLPGVSTSIVVKGVDGSDIIANSVTANQISVGKLDAISADLGSINAGSITGIAISGGTITGSTFRTADFGPRVEISSSAYSGHSIALHDGSGSSGIYSSVSGRMTIGTLSEYIAVNPLTAAVGVYAGGIAQMVCNDSGFFSNGINDNTTTNSANVSVGTSTSARVHRVTSLSRYKLDQQPIGVNYGILDALGKTWIDRNEHEEDPTYTTRTPGFVAEEIEALSESNEGVFKPLLVYSGNDELEGINYDRITAYLIPVLKDMNKRLQALEEQDGS